MKPPPLLAIGVFGILIAPVFGAETPGAVVPGAETKGPGSQAAPLLDALRARDALFLRVYEGKTTAGDALSELRREAKPYGLGLDGTAEFALAAIDVGHRLLGRRRPKEAEPFFQAAESELGKALSTASVDRDVSVRVLLLRNRALLRASYLGKAAEAELDFSEAIRLQPANEALTRQRDAVLGGRDKPDQLPTIE